MFEHVYSYIYTYIHNTYIKKHMHIHTLTYRNPKSDKHKCTIYINTYTHMHACSHIHISTYIIYMEIYNTHFMIKHTCTKYICTATHNVFTNIPCLCTHIFTHIQIDSHIHIYKFMFTHIYVHIQHTDKNTHTCMHMHVPVCTCI